MNIEKQRNVFIVSLMFFVTLMTSITVHADTKSLYDRLGGYDAIATVVDKLMQDLAEDAQVGRFLSHIPDGRATHVRQHMVDFICSVTGGPCVYVGKDMKSAHSGMGLTDSDWNITVSYLTDVLNDLSVPKQEQTELLTSLASLKSSVVD